MKFPSAFSLDKSVPPIHQTYYLISDISYSVVRLMNRCGEVTCTFLLKFSIQYNIFGSASFERFGLSCCVKCCFQTRKCNAPQPVWTQHFPGRPLETYPWTPHHNGLLPEWCFHTCELLLCSVLWMLLAVSKLQPFSFEQIAKWHRSEVIEVNSLRSATVRKGGHILTKDCLPVGHYKHSCCHCSVTTVSSTKLYTGMKAPLA